MLREKTFKSGRVSGESFEDGRASLHRDNQQHEQSTINPYSSTKTV
jgi:hypothetical protein